MAAYDGMVSALSVLADSAAAKFDQQVAATASLASALGSAITAMRESAALTQQLQQKYVEQTLMLQDATGTGVTEACNRTRAWAAAFTINRCTVWRVLNAAALAPCGGFIDAICQHGVAMPAAASQHHAGIALPPHLPARTSLSGPA